MKKCCRCRQNKEVTNFGVAKRSKDGLRGYCSDCKNLENKVYARTAKGRASKAKHNTKTRKERGPKYLARKRLNKAVENGKIEKPQNCTICGIEGETIHGHHWSYLEENSLNVVWCCSPCHTVIHN